MKKLFTFLTFFTFTTLISFAQKKVEMYRAGVLYATFSTINSALASAASGDSILLSPHTFYESGLFIGNKGIVLQGTMTSTDSSIIDASYDTSQKVLFTFQGGSANQKYTIRDVIFTHGYRTGISAAGWTDTLIITGNTIIRENGSAIIPTLSDVGVDCGLTFCAGGGGQTTISGNVKIYNNIGTGGAGICWTGIAYKGYNPGKLTIKDSVQIFNNHAIQRTIPVAAHPGYFLKTGRGGGLLILDNYGTWKAGTGSVFITDKVKIWGNEADSAGGGICIFGYNRVNIGKDVIIEGNSAPRGGGIAMMKNDGYQLLFRTGANPQLGSLEIDGGQIINNQADKGAAFYLSANTYDSTTSTVNISRARIYNPKPSGIRQNEVFASYSSFPPVSISLLGNWWGKSDTIGVLQENPKGLSALDYWAVANWTVKNGTPVVKADTTFPVAAAIKYNHGLAFPASSFAMLKGTFTVDTGTFTPVTANINSSNVVSSIYKTIKDSLSKSFNADIVAWIDADTFKTIVLVWSIDTLPTVGGIQNKTLPQVMIYPNPATDFINIEGVESGSSIELYDLMGKLARFDSAQPDKQIVDIKSLPVGIYTLKITTKEGNVGTAKVVKE